MQFLRRAMAVCVSSLLATTALAEARQIDQYKSIIDRNPFGLKDPPPPPPPQTNPPAKLEKKDDFYLTGITTIGNNKKPKVYLLSKDTTKKEYDQKYYSLGIGERQGDVALLDVDTQGRRVRIAYLGEERWLSMKDNGVPAPAGPAPGMSGPGGITPQPGGAAVPIPLPGASMPAPHPQPVTYPSAGSTRRTPRSASNGYNAGGYGAPSMMGNAGLASQNGIVPNPMAINGNPATVQAGNTQTPQPPVDPAVQVLMMHANYQHAIQHGEVYPPVPMP